VEAYCVKCKQKREIAEPEATFTASGTPATKGKCVVCGTNLYRMGRTEAHEGMTPPPEAKRKRKKTRSRAKRKGKLVIVESPAKARTVGRFLGRGYTVMASVGHVRDLLRSQLSVDVENDFIPKYRVPKEKRQIVKDLKAASANATDVYLATDPDREGEAIAWHLLEAANIDSANAHRVVFHEITQSAIEKAFEQPRDLEMNLVDAQQARRILDRLVGYNLSPLLWAKVRGRLSAGRVQSVALRLVVEREREIQAFVPTEYWSIDAEFVHPEKPPAFKARLVQIDDAATKIDSEDEAKKHLEDLRTAQYHVESIHHGSRKRRPAAPFTTSTMQQAASRRLGYTARKTMAIAQQLYEGVDFGEGERVGLITYMRTDSTQLSAQAVEEARGFIQSHYGSDYLPEKPPVYRTSARKAQEAHEAIRPTSAYREPKSLRSYLKPDQYKLYSLIWSRFVGSQMNPAVYDTLTIEVGGRSDTKMYVLKVNASSIRFPGFLKVYGKRKTADNGADGDKEQKEGLRAQLAQLPDLLEGDPLDLIELFPEQHFTQPPHRYSDATLVRALEEHGIGRPSTYAPIISTLRQRGYVRREKKQLLPTEIGEIVNDLIVEHFPNVVNVGFTAKMEEQLDEVADGGRDWVDVVRRFYVPFAEQLKKAEELMPEVKAEPEEIGRDCPECGSPLLLRHGRFGKFIGCSNFPTCRFTEPWLEKIGVPCPEDGGDIVIRHTRKGRVFYGCANYPECEFTSWKRPLPQKCPKCGGMLVVDNKEHASCIKCGEKCERSELQEVETDLA
jgi:DNA topoisomerase-1